MHFQNIDGQGKLVSCVKGKIYDVLVDLRKDSNTYREWIMERGEMWEKGYQVGNATTLGYFKDKTGAEQCVECVYTEEWDNDWDPRTKCETNSTCPKNYKFELK